MSIKFTNDHEWARADGDTITVGITDYAQEKLGDIVFVELPEVGASLTQNGDAGVIESVKAASDIYSPVSGEVTEVNTGLEDEPEKVNDDAQGDGWLFKLKAADSSEFDALMDESAYQAFLETCD